DMVQTFGAAADQLKTQLARVSSQANSAAVIPIKLTLARTLYCQARHVYQLGLPQRAQALCEESLSYWPDEPCDEAYGADRVHVKLFLGDALYEQGRYAESESICQEVRYVCQANGDL